MNRSHILLLSILCIIFILVLNKILIILNKSFNNEHINNDLPDNQITLEGNNNILIPTSEQVYNPNDTNRPDNQYGHQETNLLNNNNDTVLVNTDESIPLVYSMDELEDTTIIRTTPSNPQLTLDAGSGPVNMGVTVNNNMLNNFNSIE
jgi:hypothetical protein